jgi:hypothetical protein
LLRLATGASDRVTKKVLLLVVDACTPAVLEAGMAKRRLPNLERLRRAGFYDGACSAIFPSITPAATASIVTGCYPVDHGVIGAHWFDDEKGEVLYYGDDLDVIREQGIGRYFERLVVGLNADLLAAETLFERVERAGGRTACVNYLVFRGTASHVVRVPLWLRLLPGMPRAKQVPGPSALYLGDFVSTPLAGSGRRPRHAGGPRHRFGMDDRGSADVLVPLVRDGLPDLTVAYFPDYDWKAHRVGPWAAMPALESFDAHLGRVFAAAGGLDRLLRGCAVVVTSDHSQSKVASSARAELPLHRALRGLSVANDAGQPWGPGDDAKICVNMRTAQVYLRRPRQDVVEGAARELLAHERVDQVLFRLATDRARGGPGYAVGTRDRGWLRFWSGGDGPAVRDEWGHSWSYEGDLAAVAAEVGADGVLRSARYPNPLERIACALEAKHSGELWLTAVPGVELTLAETNAHRGGGAHGSLIDGDSLTPLLAAGLPAGLEPKAPTRTVDVAPLCLSVLGIQPDRPVGASHMDKVSTASS